ncbi:zinc-binding metallopeptidase family protein [Hwanghaeella sp.]|uniref:zinc-binding metallopeptidase family protein n=1 Tax=Hwanghaeella sp. TaxID=2605943 RepID=UPI003CCBDCB9
MKLFECHNCGQVLFFENGRCEQCGLLLGFLPEVTSLSALTSDGGDLWHTVSSPGDAYRFCANSVHGVCNWLIPAQRPDSFCTACKLNRTVPNLDVTGNLALWQRLETAKHRMVYGLLRLRLPLTNRIDDTERGLAFDFLSDKTDLFREGPQVITGHAQGVITINLAEADDAERERHRRDMAEPYRTLLGHFRHEVGHHYWERLVRGSDNLDAFRNLFGDEQQDYAAALSTHYAYGPSYDWQQHHVSSYASSHPWEDFAETWAHYMHIVDTLETAAAFGIKLQPGPGPSQATDVQVGFDPYRQRDFDPLIGAWLPLTYAVNSMNRSMGQPDLYPFVLAPPVIDKLRFVHNLINAAEETSPTVPTSR